MNPKLHFLFYCFRGKSFHNKRLFKCRHHNKGFSLLDLQVAIVVLSFGILGLTQSMVSSFEQNSDGLSLSLIHI